MWHFCDTRCRLFTHYQPLFPSISIVLEPAGQFQLKCHGNPQVGRENRHKLYYREEKLLRTPQSDKQGLSGLQGTLVQEPAYYQLPSQAADMINPWKMQCKIEKPGALGKKALREVSQKSIGKSHV